MSPDKGVHLAVQAARRARVPIVVAGPTHGRGAGVPGRLVRLLLDGDAQHTSPAAPGADRTR